VITTLLLRGAQTPGNCVRASRMHEFSDMQEVEQTLEGLATREDGPYVQRLAREPASVKAAICTCSAVRWNCLRVLLKPMHQRAMRA
jgi:uncharacterized protein YceH (UPF0502 family)